MSEKFQFSRLIGLLAVGALLVGCLDVEMHTRVHPNGSLTRYIEVKGDSADIFNSGFPVPRDESWQPVFTPAEENRVYYRIEKQFPDVDALNAEFEAGDRFTPAITIRGELERKFRWFTTELTYREIHSVNNPITAVPLESYIKPGDLELLFLNLVDPKSVESDSSEIVRLETQLNEWYIANEFTAFFDLLIKAAAHRDAGECVETLRTKREAMFQDILQQEIEPGNVAEWTEYFEGFLEDSTLRSLVQANQVPFGLLDQQYQIQDEIIFSQYVNRISLPDNISASNASEVDGVTAYWPDYSVRLLTGEVEMWARTRHLNAWAWLVSILILLAVAYGFYRRRT